MRIAESSASEKRLLPSGSSVQTSPQLGTAGPPRRTRKSRPPDRWSDLNLNGRRDPNHLSSGRRDALDDRSANDPRLDRRLGAAAALRLTRSSSPWRSPCSAPCRRDGAQSSRPRRVDGARWYNSTPPHPSSAL